MRHPDLVGFLFRILPFDAWKDALLRRHIESCADCRGRLASREEARRVIISGEDAGIPGGFWPAIAERIEGREMVPATTPRYPAATVPEPRRRVWRWAAAVAGLGAAFLATAARVLFFRSTAPSWGPEAEAAEADQIQIHYVKIGDEPALTFIFKPHDSDVVIVWAGKTH